MALGSTQPLTEMSARNISWGKGGRCVGLTTLSCADFLKSGSLNLLEPSRSVMGLLYLYLYYTHIRGRGNSVVIAIRYGLEGQGIESRWRQDFRDPPSLLCNEYRDFPGSKTVGVWRWPPTLSSVQVKEYGYTSTPAVGLRGLFCGGLYLYLYLYTLYDNHTDTLIALFCRFWTVTIPRVSRRCGAGRGGAKHSMASLWVRSFGVLSRAYTVSLRAEHVQSYGCCCVFLTLYAIRRVLRPDAAWRACHKSVDTFGCGHRIAAM
jgi:hypothetical protein